MRGSSSEGAVAGAGAGAGMGAGSSAGVPSTPSAISAFSSFSSENTESDTEAVLDFVWLTRSFETSMTESYWTEFLSSVYVNGEGNLAL